MKSKLVISLVLVNFYCFGQKSNLQQVSIWAPNDIKIDGKATELKNKFQSYDRNNSIYYTILNDGNRLYLILKTREFRTINKIYMGGISFSVSSPGKVLRNEVKVTFPVIQRRSNFTVIQAHNQFNVFRKDSLTNKEAIKSLIQSSNKQFIATYKELNVSGLNRAKDQLISIYNSEGLSAKALLDDAFGYTYEMSLPLKYLESALNGKLQFKYNIKLNGSNGVGNTAPAGPASASGAVNMNQLYLSSTTDFGGDCVLVKK